MATGNIKKLNPIQLHLLKMFNYTTSEKNLEKLKEILAKFYAEKVDEEMDRIWEKKKLTQAKLTKMSKEHKRTPYKK